MGVYGRRRQGSAVPSRERGRHRRNYQGEAGFAPLVGGDGGNGAGGGGVGVGGGVNVGVGAGVVVVVGGVGVVVGGDGGRVGVVVDVFGGVGIGVGVGDGVIAAAATAVAVVVALLLCLCTAFRLVKVDVGSEDNRPDSRRCFVLRPSVCCCYHRMVGMSSELMHSY